MLHLIGRIDQERYPLDQSFTPGPTFQLAGYGIGRVSVGTDQKSVRANRQDGCQRGQYVRRSEKIGDAVVDLVGAVKID